MRMLCLSAVLALGAAILPAAAQTAATRFELNIPRQTLDAALKDFAEQTGMQVARFSDAVKGGVIVGPVAGRYSVQEALVSLLSPQNLSYKVVNERTIAVVDPRTEPPADPGAKPAAQMQPESGGEPGEAARGNAAIHDSGASLRLVSAQPDQENPAPRQNAAEPRQEPDTAHEVVVTGTSLRGIAPESSPVVVFTRKDIEASGQMTVEVQVDPGATRLDVALSHDTGEAQVGLYVYKMPEGKRIETTLERDDTALIYYDPSFQARKRFTLSTPPPGRYRIALDPIRVPAAGVNVAYRHATFHPLYGTVEVTDAPAPLGKAESRMTAVAVNVRARPTDGRSLVAEVGLFATGDEKKEAPVATQRWPVAGAMPSASSESRDENLLQLRRQLQRVLHAP
mgnify:CR=1 FL=1